MVAYYVVRKVEKQIYLMANGRINVLDMYWSRQISRLLKQKGCA